MIKMWACNVRNENCDSKSDNERIEYDKETLLIDWSII